jgi:hypothetical protein
VNLGWWDDVEVDGGRAEAGAAVAESSFQPDADVTVFADGQDQSR